MVCRQDTGESRSHVAIDWTEHTGDWPRAMEGQLSGVGVGWGWGATGVADHKPCSKETLKEEMGG